MSSSINHFLDASLLGLAKVAQISVRHIAHTWVYFVLGIVVGSLISIYVPKKSLARAFNHSGYLSIILASILGVLSPVGSYAVIPIFGTMLANGFPLAPIMAFLTASPAFPPPAAKSGNRTAEPSRATAPERSNRSSASSTSSFRRSPAEARHACAGIPGSSG